MIARLLRPAARAAALAAVLAVSACDHFSASGWNAKVVSGLLPDLEFHMTDDRGAAVTARDYRGGMVLLYFGYTHCPDVCPTTLARLAQVVGELGGAGRHMHILFVTVDPARDTTAQLSEYAHAFGPEVVGLRGTPAETEALVKRYRVSYSLGKPDARGDYEVMHSSGVFVFDRDGHARLLVLAEDPAPAIRADLARLAGE